MQVTKKQSTRYVLEVNQEEADWLKCVMQNPFKPTRIDDETSENEEMRSRYFHAIDRVLRNDD